MNKKILKIFLNSGKQKEAKELENLKTENNNKTLIVKSLLGNLLQLKNCLHKNQGKEEEPTFIELKKT